MVIAPRLNVVDSSAWLAYLADEGSAAQFADAIEDTVNLVVPAICILEVFKVVARQRGETDATRAAAVMLQGKVVDLDATLALSAARIGIARKLPLADSVVYATAQQAGAILWTQDDDFTGLPDVHYVPKSPR